jgi:hypothetical protein
VLVVQDGRFDLLDNEIMGGVEFDERVGPGRPIKIKITIMITI